MKWILIELDNWEIVYILNSLSLTRNLLYKGDSQHFNYYFNKEDYLMNITAIFVYCRRD